MYTKIINTRFSFFLSLFLTVSFLVAGCTTNPSTSLTNLAYLSEQTKGEGSYQVESYSDFPDAEEYGEAVIYYPANKSETSGGVAIAPGFRESKDNIDWWGPRLASHGFSVLVLNTNTLNDRPDVRAKALMAAIDTLRKENLRDGSPLKDKIDIDRMAIMGHSMGGGGALLAANEFSSELKAAIPFTPWQPNADFSNISIPTLVIAGEIDRIAAANTHALPHYALIPEGTKKMYLEFKGGNHFIGNNIIPVSERLAPNIDVHEAISYFSVSWLKYYLDGNEAYHELIYGEQSKQFSYQLSKFQYAD
ncbi:alpha/beta hydrolase family protein [Aurantivibrio infirmus]